MFDNTLHQMGRDRFEELLHEAELERRANSVKQVRRGNDANPLLLHIGNWLIDSGSWLKQRSEMRPGLS